MRWETTTTKTNLVSDFRPYTHIHTYTYILMYIYVVTRTWVYVHIESYGTFAKLLDLVFPSKTNGPAKKSIRIPTKTLMYVVRYYFGRQFPKHARNPHPLCLAIDAGNILKVVSCRPYIFSPVQSNRSGHPMLCCSYAVSSFIYAMVQYKIIV